jgi:AhpD family alkylhydroperoxidase
MELRLDYASVSPEAAKSFRGAHHYIAHCGLEPGLIHLVYLRVSQINGCAYCVDLHMRDALRDGDDFRRINSVITWREAPFFTPRERAALAWAESLTLVAETRAPDADYDNAKAEFSEKELVDLTYAIALMNALNRVAIGFRRGPAVEAK